MSATNTQTYCAATTCGICGMQEPTGGFRCPVCSPPEGKTMVPELTAGIVRGLDGILALAGTHGFTGEAPGWLQSVITEWKARHSEETP